ncbi:MAG: hypothetical protein GEV28_39160 [Actinophytocola sp.]|uniref:WXG100 family type VII secretion target n=1 Tax=Actinophytocola sp. TaxID=1872138 RepID=UPI001325C38D|nr:WXG100 family type VII secretion target [Actinophytocola sp.]MPZ86071.1 hypothetical protein [Actinophytocola sp.]
MAGGMEHDPDAVRAYAAVIAEAASQVEQIQAKMGAKDATAADFGNSWKDDQGAKYDKYMAAIAADLGNLTAHLSEVSGQLSQGADVVVSAESSGLKNIKEIDSRLGSEE